MRKLKVLVLSVLLVMFMVACQHKSQKSLNKPDKYTITYSNLLDKKTQNDVAKSLSKLLPAEDINLFFEQVNFYNQHIPTDSLVQSDYGTSKSLIPIYDIGAISDKWSNHFPLFPGYNCRLTTFQLVKSMIKLSPTLPADDSLLFIDKEALVDAPAIYQVKPEEQENFKILFSAVATENINDTKIHLEKVQEYWKQQGVTFAKSNVTMVSVWFHDQLDGVATKLFIGHVGMLFPSEGGYLFIEKISFEEPYQVLKFADKKALHDYLMAKYDTDTSGSTKPFIMENDRDFIG
ncbi:DUF4300 family protein [Streptococcus sp. S784/96/1]|uniref:DUF4300 family protein n=1 Tax=Streptococcus sp. S784/96/1 TaxID=2653499 RepID=UPI001386FAC5|nr:DUF4300 family protein [Streptococcus sp. S784/96/1]